MAMILNELGKAGKNQPQSNDTTTYDASAVEGPGGTPPKKHATSPNDKPKDPIPSGSVT